MSLKGSSLVLELQELAPRPYHLPRPTPSQRLARPVGPVQQRQSANTRHGRQVARACRGSRAGLLLRPTAALPMLSHPAPRPRRPDLRTWEQYPRRPDLAAGSLHTPCVRLCDHPGRRGPFREGNASRLAFPDSRPPATARGFVQSAGVRSPPHLERGRSPPGERAQALQHS